MAKLKHPGWRYSIVLLLGLLLIGLGAGPAHAVLGAPTLTSPGLGDTVGANPILTWDSLAGAAKYHVQVSAESDFSPTLYDVTTYNTAATPTTDLPLGTIYWRVQGVDSGNVAGAYADSSFVKEWAASPNVTYPADGATLNYPTDPPRFTWDPLAGAKQYRLEIDDASDFIVPTVITTVNTSYVLTEPQTIGQSWYWRVRGISSNSAVLSDWAPTRTYTIAWGDPTPAKPTLLAPPNQLAPTIEETVFSWTPVAGAALYHVQVSPNGDWANNLTINDVDVRGTTYAPANTLNNSAYFWRVRAIDAGSPANAGAWSDEWQFTRAWNDVPTLLTPTDGNTNVGTPTFSWTPVDHASSYHIEVSPDVNFSSGVLECETTATSFTPYSGCGSISLNIGTTYYWHVQALDAPTNVNGQFSDTWSFVHKEPLVTLTSPADGATNVTVPTLTWNHVPGIQSYLVTITGLNVSVSNAETHALSYTPTVAFTDGEIYTWYVVTKDYKGKVGLIPSSPRTFTYAAPGTTFSSPDILGPASGSSSVRMPSLSWKPVTGADHYRVWAGVNGSGVVSQLGVDTKNTAHTYAGTDVTKIGPNTYFWYVEAFDVSNASLGLSSAGRTFVILNPDLTSYVSPADCVNPATCVTENDTPTLSWNHVDNAGLYKVYVAVDAQFTNIVKQFDTHFNTVTPIEEYLDSQAGQAYYWFVQPCKTTTSCGVGPTNPVGYNSAYAFRKQSAPVTLLSPANSAVVADLVTFTWEDYLDTSLALGDPVDQEAKQYRIQVSTVADFSTILDTEVVDQTQYTPHDMTYPEGPLYWRVQAIDGTGNSLTMSASRLVTKQSPTVVPTFPANAALVTGVPYLQWTPQSFAAKYEVEIYKNGDLTFAAGNKVTSVITKMTAWSPTIALQAGDYAWRLRRKDQQDRVGPWSAGTIFTLTPDAPTLISPADAFVFGNNNLLFQWTLSPGAVKYRFKSSTSSTFASATETISTVMNAWAPTIKYPDGTFYWKVETLNSSDQLLAVSETRSFLHDSAAPAVVSKSPLANAAINGTFSATFSELVTGVSTATFFMRIAGTATAVPGAILTPASSGTPTTTATFKPNSILIPGQSYSLFLTAGIQDLSGNPIPATSWTVRTSLGVENTSPAIREFWDRDSHASAHGGAYKASRTPAAQLTWTFTGTTVSLLARRAPDGGYGDVFVDGVKIATASFYGNGYQIAVFNRTGMANTSHTLTLRSIGTKPTASSGTWVYPDAIRVNGVTYIEETAALDSFRRAGSSLAYAGSYDQVGHLAAGDTLTAPYLTFQFKGTGLRWYALRGKSYGKAYVFVDGALRATVDLYAASTYFKQVVYAGSGFANTVHTVVIRAAGIKNASATGYDVMFDTFTVA